MCKRCIMLLIQRPMRFVGNRTLDVRSVFIPIFVIAICLVGCKSEREKIDESNGKEFTLRVDESVHTGDGNSRWLRYQGEKWGWQIGD